jgi:hypothetical protein
VTVVAALTVPLLLATVNATGATVGTRKLGHPDAGYDGYPSASPTATYSATIQVPTIVCEASTKTPIFIDALFDAARGTEPSTGGATIEASCSGTTPHFFAFVEDDDLVGTGESVSAGDILAIAGTADSTYEDYTLTDQTTGAAVNVTGTGVSTIYNVDFGAQFGDSNGRGHFPRFTTLSYQDLSVDGSPFGEADPSSLGNATDPHHRAMVKTGAVDAGGDEFTLTYVADH